MATILMKLSEGRAAGQYNRWISVLTLWQDRAMRNYILRNLLPQRGRVLDIGCGTGTLLIEAGRRGVKGVGIDMNESMLSIARQESAKRNLGRRLKFVVRDALELNLSEEQFDLVVSTLLISELQPAELTEFVANAARFVKPGGILAIGGEDRLRGGVIGRIFSIIRRVSYWIVSRVTELGPHPHHRVPDAMKSAGLDPKYKVLFLKGLLTLYVAEAN
ncbi:MAG: class I SAM-dependent methyltransferase [Candidatus Thorarchaeota archaeon]